MDAAGIELDGEFYPLVKGSVGLRTIYEPLTQFQDDVAGASTPSKPARPDELTWTIDDLSLGEGQVKINVSDPDSLRRYYKSSGAVDVTTPGKVTLGLKLTDDSAGFTGNLTSGPYLAVTNSYLVAAASDSSGGADRSRRKNLSTGTWSALSTGTATTAGITGAIDAMGTFVYIGSRGTGGLVRRVDPSANTSVEFSSSVSESPVATNNRLYWAIDSSTGSGGQLTIRQATLIYAGSPLSFTSVYTADGVGSEAGMAGFGKKVYVATVASGENVRLHLYDGTAGVEWARLADGFRMDTSPFQGIAAVGSSLVFAGGYLEGDTGRPDAPMLVYATDRNPGVVGVIREGTEGRILCLQPGYRNKLLIGTNKGQVFIYDMATGGISEFMSGLLSTEVVTSIAMAKGKFYIAVRAEGSTPKAGKVYSTKATGTDKYPASSTVESSTYDFRLPHTEKLARYIEVQTESLPAGTSVEVQLVLDGTTITTDSAGATMAHSTGTRTRFTISDADTERIFYRAKINILLKTSNSANTPTLESVTFVAESLGTAKFYEFTADLSRSVEVAGNMRTPADMATQLRTLIENSSNRVVGWKPYYMNNQHPHEMSATTENVRIVEGDIPNTTPGQGTARVKVKVM